MESNSPLKVSKLLQEIHERDLDHLDKQVTAEVKTKADATPMHWVAGEPAGTAIFDKLDPKLGEPDCAGAQHETGPQIVNIPKLRTGFLKIAPVDQESAGVKYDGEKIQFSLIPPYALKECAYNLTVGLRKYPHRDNWKLVDNGEERYLDAMYRHMEAHRRGEIFDPESSVPDMYHLAAAVVNGLFLLEKLTNPTMKGLM